MPPDISPGSLEVVFKHRCLFYRLCSEIQYKVAQAIKMLHTMGWLVSAKRLAKKILLIYFVIQSTFNIFEFQIVFEILIMIKMETKTFSVVTSISMVLALTVVVLSIIGIAITGFYPGMIVF